MERRDTTGRSGKLTGDGRRAYAERVDHCLYRCDGRVGTKTAASVTAFESIGCDKLNDLRTSNILAVLPDGTKLDEATLRAKT